MATTLYGIKNCDTMKKARAWLAKGATASETVNSLLRKAGLFKQPAA